MMMINYVKIFTRDKCKMLQKTYGKTQNAGVDRARRKWKFEHKIQIYSRHELNSSSQIYKKYQNQRKLNSVRHIRTVDINA